MNIKFDIHCLKDDAKSRLFEDSLSHAAQSESSDRRLGIANIVAKYLTKTDIKIQEGKMLLALYNQLNDVEVIILSSFNMNLRNKEMFMDRHKAIFRRGEERTPTHYDLGLQHLASLGLLKPVIKTRPWPKANFKIPEYDAFGKPRIGHYELTDIGKKLLKSFSD